MQSEFSRDLADPNRPIEEAFAERPGKPIRIRLHPMIFRMQGPKGGQYRAWPDVHWTLQMDTPTETFALRDAMRTFFKALTAVGPEQVVALLRTVKKQPAKPAASAPQEEHVA